MCHRVIWAVVDYAEFISSLGQSVTAFSWVVFISPTEVFRSALPRTEHMTVVGTNFEDFPPPDSGPFESTDSPALIGLGENSVNRLTL